MATIDFVVGILGVLSSLAAAALWLKSALVKMIVSPDTIEAELREINWWNARAAMAAFVAALCAAYVFGRQVHWL